MPIFEYKCEKCGYKEEILERSSKPTKHMCPKCKDIEMKKQFSTFSCGQSDGAGSDSCPTCPTGTCPTGTCPF